MAVYLTRLWKQEGQGAEIGLHFRASVAEASNAAPIARPTFPWTALPIWPSGPMMQLPPRLLFLGCLVALDTWDDEHWAALSAEAVRLCRAAGALADLQAALSARALLLVFTGELSAAASASGEMAALIEATGSSMAQFGAMALAAVRGRQDEVSAWVETTSRDIALRGEGDGIAKPPSWYIQ